MVNLRGKWVMSNGTNFFGFNDFFVRFPRGVYGHADRNCATFLFERFNSIQIQFKFKFANSTNKNLWIFPSN